MNKFTYGLLGIAVGAGLTATSSVLFNSTAHTMDMTDTVANQGTDMAAMHMHPPRPVSADLPVPSVTHLVFPDAVDGYNVQILTQNFDFTPAAINRAVQDNAGHAHIYVNGVKIGRVYAPWYHLPSALFHAGENQVTVTLNANDHSEWAVGDAPISATVVVIRSE